MFDAHFWVNLICFTIFFCPSTCCLHYCTGEVDKYFPFSTTIGNSTRQVGFQSLNRRLKECVLDRRGDCHCLPVWLCSHNKNTGSKWTTKHPLSGPARLTRIYWATRRNEKEIFLTPTAAKGTERKFNNTLCDQPPHCTGGEPFRHTIFCHYRNLITHFSIFFIHFPVFTFHFYFCMSFVCYLVYFVSAVFTAQRRGWRTVDGGYFAFLSTEHLCPVSQAVVSNSQDGASVCCVLMFGGGQWGKMQT